MLNVGKSFRVLHNDSCPPVGWRKVTCHLLSDMKMYFTRKATWVLDDHKNPNPIGSTYVWVVSRDSIRIAFTYDALNGLDICAVVIRNSYLQAPSPQKYFIICKKEFGLENIGKKALIRRALYGGKYSGRDLRNHLHECVRHLDFVYYPADPDVWMWPAKKIDESEYYKYDLLYTDRLQKCINITQRRNWKILWIKGGINCNSWTLFTWTC